MYETAFDSRPLHPPLEPDSDALLEASRILCGNRVESAPAKEENNTFSPSVEFKKLEVGATDGDALPEESSPRGSWASFGNNKLRTSGAAKKTTESSSESCSTSSDSVAEACFLPKRRKPETEHFKEDLMKRPNGESNAALRSHLWLDLSRAPKRQRRHLCLDDLEDNLLKQEWYHGSIGRGEAESLLRLLKKGSFLVRCSHKTKQYLLSLKSSLGVVHVKLCGGEDDGFQVGGERFSSVPRLVHHFRSHLLCVHGMSLRLSHPVPHTLL